MVLDIIIVAIVVLAMVFGFRRGFIYSFTHTLGWVVALVGGIFLSPYVKQALINYTGFDDFIDQTLWDRFGNASADAVLNSEDGLPELIKGSIQNSSENLIQTIVDSFANLILIIASFVLVFLIIKLILHIIFFRFSKKHKNGFTGFFDGFLGLIAGAIKGIIFVFVLLAIMVPVINMIDPDMMQVVLNTLDKSVIAKVLYDNNFIVLIEQVYFS